MGNLGFVKERVGVPYGVGLCGVVSDGGPRWWASLEFKSPSTIWVWSGLLSVHVNWVSGWAEVGGSR